MGLLLTLLLFGIWPTCPAEGRIASEYGYRRHPISGRVQFHRGVDITNALGTPVRSPWPGRVVRVKRGHRSGLYVVVRYGKFRLIFAHLDTTRLSRGDRVAPGDLIGRMGASGRTTGPHLHLEMRRRGRRINPSFALLGCPRASE